VTTGEVQVPLDRQGKPVFKLGSTLPVKVRITDCSGAPATGLAPRVSVALVTPTGDKPVRVVGSSSEDKGDVLRFVDGQYVHTLSLKASRFEDGKALTAGQYRVRVSDPSFGSVERVVTFTK
jgi:hypothetical protein